MNTNGGVMLIIAKNLALVAVLLVVSGCSKTVSWTEEVKLSNDKTITIERETRHRPGGGEIALNSGWRPDMFIVRFKHNYPPRGVLDIEWKTSKWDAEGVTWPEMPLYFDISEDKQFPVVITIHALRGACFEYLRYAYRDGGWYEDALPDKFEPFQSNLYIAGAALDIPRQVSLKEKASVMNDFQYSKRFKVIGPKRIDCKA